MYSVIISDDEPIVCQLIIKLIDWDAMPLELVGTASNGLDAFSLIQQYKPDIVITDIRMPGMDGLELIEKIKNIGISTQFIIISGYRQFTYAHSAIKFDVKDYLLKPINEADLNECLRKIVLRLDADEERRQMDQRTELQLQSSRIVRDKYLINTLWNKPSFFHDEQLEGINAQYGTSFHAQDWQAIIFQLDGGESADALICYAGSIFENLLTIWNDWLLSSNINGISAQDGAMLTCLVNLAPQAESAVSTMLDSLLERMQQFLIRFGGISLTIGLGGVKQSLIDSRVSMEEAERCIQRRLIFGVGRVIQLDTPRPLSTVGLQTILPAALETRLINAISALDGKKVDGCICEVFRNFRAEPYACPSVLWRFCEQLNSLIVNHIPLEEQTDSLENHLHQLTFVTSVDRMLALLRKAIDALFLNIASKVRVNEQRPIRMAKQFVQDHYMENLRLEDVANQVHMNAAYFSTLFKKETGVNFSDYLVQCRIDAAKELLRKSDATIAEIAERAGYAESKYFSKQFLKIVGLKPSQYRKLYS